jgi:hypothetical protein
MTNNLKIVLKPIKQVMLFGFLKLIKFQYITNLKNLSVGEIALLV